ncbi:PREDICTED: RUS1 family protein C16orf58 homolog isoform X2 [Ceratosolen solmsi marchali]|uniref:RUS1 family protein C16orf58 homolog isoform X2 n=1 Tax=Ceratosolen solmsi marchali TaxID=326594 RepID=A0AAJ6YY56_9HYME|nr:PREDICTED: RUS1 family protein C16orf58 homolog isoform X2 [Ceratosolen solmsi marchali]
MFNDELRYSENDNFLETNVEFHKSTNKPLIYSMKLTKGIQFSDSLICSLFKEVFLPQGFPESVHTDYIEYQIWDSLQAFASTINGTLATHSIMRGVGVGESTATPLVAAITWILKDGTGMIGRIIFAWWQGHNLDSHCKRWRLFADILNDAAMVIEITVPYTHTFSSYILCLTTGMKAIVGIAGGATRTAIMQHHAINDNMADVSAKEHSQGTLVNLVGSIVGIMILLIVHESLFIYICIGLVIVHITCNYYAVTSLKINTLNDDRLCLLIESYFLNQNIPSVERVNEEESILVLFKKPAQEIFGFNIEIGVSFKKMLEMKLIDLTALKHFQALFQLRKYLPIIGMRQRTIYIVLSKDSCDDDILRAYFHSSLYAMILSRIEHFIERLIIMYHIQ